MTLVSNHTGSNVNSIALPCERVELLGVNRVQSFDHPPLSPHPMSGPFCAQCLQYGEFNCAVSAEIQDRSMRSVSMESFVSVSAAGLFFAKHLQHTSFFKVAKSVHPRHQHLLPHHHRSRRDCWASLRCLQALCGRRPYPRPQAGKQYGYALVTQQDTGDSAVYLGERDSLVTCEPEERAEQSAMLKLT